MAVMFVVELPVFLFFREREGVTSTRRWLEHACIMASATTLHVDVWSFLIFFIVVVKAGSHYSSSTLTGVTYVEKRTDRPC